MGAQGRHLGLWRRMAHFPDDAWSVPVHLHGRIQYLSHTDLCAILLPSLKWSLYSLGARQFSFAHKRLLPFLLLLRPSVPFLSFCFLLISAS